ncbi:MAG TPA: aldo/keto reductase, partial [Lacipirellulaceae bacterium]|nr:aldo/keto reductase [Lacipirellulaceae bacterium]
MKRKPLGRTDLLVSPIALGGNVFGWTIDEKTSFCVLDAFIDSGFNLIDTANMYSAWVPGHKGGESESIIGNWCKASGKRDKVLIATKVGMKMGDGMQGLTRDNILKACDDSLRRLQTDHIDLYQSHRD